MMAKKRQTSSSRSKPDRNRAQKSKDPSGSTPDGTVVKKTGNSATLIEGNGDFANGKMRYKSLVIDGTKYRTRLNTKFEKRQSWENPDSRKITSTIPGTIIKVYIKEGQEVKPGDQMLILEAMKMKNRIIFHDGGTVKSLHVKEGEKIPKDHLMVELK
jgi:biotin carboxyl carrier protein